MNFTLPENLAIVMAHEPVAADALGTCDYVCCKNVHKLWVVLSHYSAGGDTDLVVTWNEATNVSAGSAAAITVVCPIWYNVDTASADLLTRATDAITYTVDTGAGLNQIWVMEWDPAKFSDGFDCFALVTTGGHASNLVSVTYFAQMRYQSAVLPTIITD